MRTGDFMTPTAPYGYRLNTEARTLDIEPVEAEVVRRIFTAFLAGQGKKDISDMLNSEGIPKAKKAGQSENTPEKWHPSTVHYILTNISYTGDAIWQKYYTTDTIPFKTVINKGEMPRYHVQNSHLPIISHEDFDNTQRLLSKKRTQFYKGSPAADTPLAKTVYCECGTLCRRKVIGGKTYWTCWSHDMRGKDTCPVRQVPEPSILAAFARMWDKLKRHSGEILTPLSEHLTLVTERRQRSNATLNEVNKELISLTEQVHVLESLKSKGYLEPALYRSQRGELDKKITVVRKAKNRLMAEDDGSFALPVDDLIIALESGEPDDEGFTDIVERVTLMAEDKVLFRLRCGFEIAECIERAVR
jgi:hypothetical protein